MMPPLFAPGVSIRGEIASTGTEFWAVNSGQWERLKWTGKGMVSMSSAEVGDVACYSPWWEEPSLNEVQRTFLALGFPFLSFINYETGFYFGDLADLKIPLAQPPSGGIMALFSLHSYLSSLKSLSACHFQSQI